MTGRDRHEPTLVDRDQVREILVAAGTAAEDLNKLMASCSSVEDARGYRPPARSAWFIECGNVRPCDARGCLVCRGGAELLVWAAVFAAHWTSRREAQRKYGGDAGDAEIAVAARDEARSAVRAMREVAAGQDPEEV